MSYAQIAWPTNININAWLMLMLTINYSVCGRPEKKDLVVRSKNKTARNKLALHFYVCVYVAIGL